MLIYVTFYQMDVVKLNEAACSLARRLPAARSAREEVLGDCEKIREQIRELREKLRQLPSLPVHDDPLVQLRLEELRLKAQLRVWQQHAKPEDALPRDQLIISARCKQQLKESVEAHQLAICIHAEHLCQLELRVKREGELYKGYERLYASMMDQWTQLTRRHTSVASTISAIKEECSKLEKKLGSFAAEQEGGEEEGAGMKRKHQVSNETSDSFVQVIELLWEKHEQVEEGGGGDGYIPMDALHASNVEALLRAKVVETHPDDPSRIRMVSVGQL